MEFEHVPVLLNEVIEYLNIKENGTYVDCTLGGGGHSFEILKRLSKNGKLIGIDQDIKAIEASKERLKDFNNVIYVHDNFYNIDTILKGIGTEKVDGIIMDLGISSYQIDNPERGFSYMKDSPLDMRMNTDNSLTAFDVVNNYSQDELTRIFREYGEERFAKRIAGFIVNERNNKSISSTSELVSIIKNAIPMKFQRNGHPAKKVFQAIRIEVNKELDVIDNALENGINHLGDKGRIAVITFHSLEDRIVKNKFKKLENPCTCPSDFPVCVCGKKPVIKIVTSKPIEPTEEEKELNKRSKSAKLRIAEKI